MVTVLKHQCEWFFALFSLTISLSSQHARTHTHTHTHTHTQDQNQTKQKKLLSYVSHVRMVPDTLIG